MQFYLSELSSHQTWKPFWWPGHPYREANTQVQGLVSGTQAFLQFISTQGLWTWQMGQGARLASWLPLRAGSLPCLAWSGRLTYPRGVAAAQFRGWSLLPLACSVAF
jgi:hypothetical protein